MALQIHVRDKSLKQGDQLRGFVTLDPDAGSEYNLKTLLIRLLGVSKTRITTGKGINEKIHKNSVTFLELEKEYQTGPATLKSGHVSQFLIDTPEDPASARDRDELRTPHLMQKPKPQTLPPSTDFGFGNLIAYKVEAFAVTEDHQISIRSSAGVEYIQNRFVEVPDPQIITVLQEHRLYSRDDLISSRLEFAIDAPRIVALGQNFPLILRLLPKDKQGDVDKVPEVILRSCSVQLLVHTSVSGEDQIESEWTTRYRLDRDAHSKYRSNEIRQISSQGIDLRKISPDLRIPRPYTPTLKSPNIERTYGLTIWATVQCRACLILSLT